MSLRFPHRGTGGHSASPAPGQGHSSESPGATAPAESPASYPDRACCCPARPMVKVIMPATAARPATDLWLCGHHWRVSCKSLLAAGAVCSELPEGIPPAPVEQTPVAA
jgi:hypothetical protein